MFASGFSIISALSRKVLADLDRFQFVISVLFGYVLISVAGIGLYR
jgi:hypothetical protein